MLAFKYISFHYIKYFIVILSALVLFLVGFDYMGSADKLDISANLLLIYLVYKTFFAIDMLLPLSLIFIRENMNTTLRGRKDLENMTIPFIGEIPLSGQKKPGFGKGRKHFVVVEEKNRDNITKKICDICNYYNLQKNIWYSCDQNCIEIRMSDDDFKDFFHIS